MPICASYIGFYGRYEQLFAPTKLINELSLLRLQSYTLI